MRTKKNQFQHHPSISIQQTGSLCFPICCPEMTINHDEEKVQQGRKCSKFISITLNKAKIEQKQPNFQKKAGVAIHLGNTNTPKKEFQTDKSDFLSQIRKFSPNPQFQKEENDKGDNTFDSSKGRTSSMKSGENNLSSLLQNLSSDMFSDMFVSSTIKGKIIMSGSLGSISEVISQMENSCQTETIVNTLRFHDEH